MNPASDPDEADDNVEDNVDAESTDGPIA